MMSIGKAFILASTAGGMILSANFVSAATPKVKTYPGIKGCNVSSPPCYVLAKTVPVSNTDATSRTTDSNKTNSTPKGTVSTANPAETDTITYGCLNAGTGTVTGATNGICANKNDLLVLIVS